MNQSELETKHATDAKRGKDVTSATRGKNLQLVPSAGNASNLSQSDVGFAPDWLKTAWLL